MAKEKKEIKCAWCGEAMPASEARLRRYQNDFGRGGCVG